MTPREQFERCRQIWLDALRPAHDKVCDERLDHGPWIEALQCAAAELACLRAHRGFVADLLLLTADGIRNGDAPPEPVLMPPGTPQKTEASRLFLEALRTAEHQVKLRHLDSDQTWIGFRMALCGYVVTRLRPEAATRIFAELVECIPDIVRQMESQGSLAKDRHDRT